VLLEAETQVRYEGYLDRQAQLAEHHRYMEETDLPVDLDFTGIAGLTREVVEKLSRLRPRSLGQAGRISGVTPAALACLEIHLRKIGRR
jgi:NAD/FAD-utilizing enzyme apparently involved in cell division